MELKRKPFQGVFNIIRFNWHFYLIAGFGLILLLLLKHKLPAAIQPFAFTAALLAASALIVSLFVSFYIYDLSNLYQLNWLTGADYKKILNIHAGFDDTSEVIKNKFPNSELKICDFYDPVKHKEVSIKRARKAYPPDKSTIQVASANLPFPDNIFDYSLTILAAHEIREEEERVYFFKELNRVTKPAGEIMVTEHLRDWNNFLAYTIGFFHFNSKSTWLKIFAQADLTIKREIKTTPFLITFVLEKNGRKF